MDNRTWYANKEILFECIHQLKHREMAFKLVPQDPNARGILTRGLKAFTIEYFEKHAKRWDFWDSPKNLYTSLATYSYLPVMSFNVKERKPQREAWNLDYINHITALDIGIDFDALDIHDAYVDCKIVKEMLDKYEVGYVLSFSSNKGFHIRIPYEYLPHMPDITEQSLLHKEILETLHYEHGCKTIDLCVFNPNRIWKVCWSYDFKSGLIKTPLTDSMFRDFTTEMCLPQNVMDNCLIRDTHLYERRRNIPTQTKVMNAIEWIESLNKEG